MASLNWMLKAHLGTSLRSNVQSLSIKETASELTLMEAGEASSLSL
jgi:hypothetical protein